MDGKIQVIGPIVHGDVLARLDIDCENFRGVRNATKSGKRYSRETSSGTDSISQRCRYQINTKFTEKRKAMRND